MLEAALGESCNEDGVLMSSVSALDYRRLNESRASHELAVAGDLHPKKGELLEFVEIHQLKHWSIL